MVQDLGVDEAVWPDFVGLIMLKKIADAFREWIDMHHYGSVSGMLLEYGMAAFTVIVIALLVQMFLSAM